jgi:hypothetical protein
MSQGNIETLFLLFALALFGLAAAAPRHLIRILGMGRVRPSEGSLIFLRVTAGVSILGTLYRLVVLHMR